MFSKKIVLGILAGLTLTAAAAVPSQAEILGISFGPTFRGTVTQLNGNSIQVVDFENKKVMHAFLSADAAVNTRIESRIQPGNVVKMEVSQAKDGRWIIRSIKKLK